MREGYFSCSFTLLRKSQSPNGNRKQKNRNQILLVNENRFAYSSYKVKGRYRAKPYIFLFLFSVIAKYGSPKGQTDLRWKFSFGRQERIVPVRSKT